MESFENTREFARKLLGERWATRGTKDPIVEVEINEESSSSDNNDSAEDEVYKPGPEIFEVEEEDIPKNAKKKKGKAKAHKGQNVVHEEEEDERDVQYHDLHYFDSDPEDGFAEELLQHLDKDTPMGGMRFEDDDNDNDEYHSEGPDHWPLSEDEREGKLEYPYQDAVTTLQQIHLLDQSHEDHASVCLPLQPQIAQVRVCKLHPLRYHSYQRKMTLH
ncbi:uncharacterized protein G2W53_040563 [Senna tora]|uniref:Uncharacterized protein n=1 Tax=Senna tora TaxID=362788 RepID=A0A834SIG9_9FABA|nr:uncharacterized protein G2W53_040563 [Senna tora]